ncbi:MAG TPA: nitronate monooxygenase [Candidatus Dormibacteraeota bacterium]|nr:nitronate monooxygenase [Candidatus Dormibacteraeota bacterium]
MSLHTRVTRLLDIEHPVVMGGMGGGATVPAMVTAVSEAGGLGVLGVTRYPPEVVASQMEEIRATTSRPFGLNLLLFLSDDDSIATVLAQRPAVLSTAWAWPEQELAPIFERARGAGARTMHMVSGVEEAKRAAAAGADLIVAQGTEGGGHVGTVAAMALVPMVVRAVAPIPVIAAGGLATGPQLAAALMLGADGVLMGTRFLATDESPWPPSFKRAIVDSDGHDTELSEIPDVAKATAWPGAFDRVRRNRLISAWAGREHELRRRRAEVSAAMIRAMREDDSDQGELNFGQSAGLIDSIQPCGDVVRRISAEAEAMLLGAADRFVTPSRL